ncbi:MAG: DeoR/GlpR family DNA-binding transcription regulator [Sporichthyaceae bacterium]|nr:DeoR/GlpR family DNA-binding transcription regulator [Sporichthyaceae bacterium]
MLAAERRLAIAEAISGGAAVHTDRLARRFDVSVETIRRDLLVLERDGWLKRVHGGATGLDQARPADPLAARRIRSPRMLRTQGSRAIGIAAARLVRPGQTVLLDAGAATTELARALPPSFHGVVVTASLPVAAELAGRPSVTVVLSGGRIRAGDLACAGARAWSFFEDTYADVAFLGASGLDAGAGYTDPILDDANLRRTMLAHAIQSYVLAEISALGTVAAHRIAGLTQLSGVVSAVAPPAELTAALHAAGTELVLA